MYAKQIFDCAKFYKCRTSYWYNGPVRPWCTLGAHQAIIWIEVLYPTGRYIEWYQVPGTGHTRNESLLWETACSSIWFLLVVDYRPYTHDTYVICIEVHKHRFHPDNCYINATRKQLPEENGRSSGIPLKWSNHSRFNIQVLELGMNGTSGLPVLSEHFYENQRKCPVDVWWCMSSPQTWYCALTSSHEQLSFN